MSLSSYGAFPGLLEALAALPATSSIPLDCDDVGVLLDFRDSRDELRPVVRGGIHALCCLVEDIGPTGLQALQLDIDFLGTAWHELTAFDAWLIELLAIMTAGKEQRWRDYRRHLLPIYSEGSPHLVNLLSGLARTEMDSLGRLVVSHGDPIIDHAEAVRWKLLAPSASLLATLLAAKPMHCPPIMDRLPAIAAYIRECHAGMAWLDALPDRLISGDQHDKLSA